MHTSNADTIKKIQQGDIASFEMLFKAYYQSLCRYAFQYVKTKEASEEIVQELFFQLWKNKKEVSIHTSIKAYLYKATYFNSLSFIRNEKVKTRFAESEKGKERILNEEVLEHNELKNIINTTLEKMPERGRLIFTMSRFEGLKYWEIAERLSISVKTVEATMGKALKMFRISLKDYMGMFLL